MKALVTGITGFAGTHLAEHLLASGDEVLGVSQHGQWHGTTPAELASRVRLFTWDITKYASDSLQRDIASFRPDVVYHLAGLSVPAQCGETKPTPEATAANVDGARRVMELASELDTQPRILLVSSRHVYGPADLENGRALEKWRPSGRSGYAITKIDAEMLADTMFKRQRLDCVMARAFNHTGPRQLPPLMLPDWCAQLASHRPISPKLATRSRSQPTGGRAPKFSSRVLEHASPTLEKSSYDGSLTIQNDNTWLDLSDVRDVVRAYRLLAERGKAGEIYNVGSGRAVRTGDVARRLVERASPGCEIQSHSHEEQRLPLADIRKLQAATAWRPEFSLDQTIADTWQFWVERTGGKS